MPRSQQTPVTAATTPMLKQYLEIKSGHPDSILFFRLGDFYEMFFEDATTAAPLLEVQLTSRDKNSPNPIPMCGVPYHAAAGYVQKLLAAGKKVAICDQVEESSSAKGLVKREVTRVVTPALVADPELVPEDARNILGSIYDNGKETTLSFLDLLSGQIWKGTTQSLRQIQELFSEFSPKELLIPEGLDGKKWFKELLRYFPGCTVTRRNQYFTQKDPQAALLDYLRETQRMSELPHLKEVRTLEQSHSLKLDSTTLKSLEVIRSEGEGASLFETVDRTKTSMGRRLLKDWLIHPLYNLNAIKQRHSAVEYFLENRKLADEIASELASIRDLERLTTKTALRLAMPRDLVMIRETLRQVPNIRRLLSKTNVPLLEKCKNRLQPLTPLLKKLSSGLTDDPPATTRDGNIIKDSYSAQVAEYRSLTTGTKKTLASLEEHERSKTGISNLKLKFSRVFGYTFEVSKSQLSKVPKDFIRKQTIANGERFITEKLKRLEERIVTAEEKLRKLEETIFLELRQSTAKYSQQLLGNAQVLAEIDVLLSFSQSAKELNYTKPTMSQSWDLSIVDGRHPVVETFLPAGKFVPNDTSFCSSSKTLMITGPNMSGKSTIMRQCALIVVLAHAGSFVPARKAKIPLVDSVFTRIGASDDLASGRSTFMVEMTEMSRILNQASEKSLILIDEIGRGTSTYDGLSLAWSILEFIHRELGAKTLFATHFHELTQLEKSLKGLKNCNVLVEKWKGNIVFLYKLGDGACSQSYGIEVAKLAEIPSKVLLRARQVLGHLESQPQKAVRSRNNVPNLSSNQLLLFDLPKSVEKPIPRE